MKKIVCIVRGGEDRDYSVFVKATTGWEGQSQIWGIWRSSLYDAVTDFIKSSKSRKLIEASDGGNLRFITYSSVNIIGTIEIEYENRNYIYAKWIL